MAANSTNPFRNKALTSAFSTRPQAPSSAAFLESISSLPGDGHAPDPPPATKSKVVKRVRVQTPPPPSPDSSINELDYSSDDTSNNATDPFETRFPLNLSHSLPEAAPLVAANRTAGADIQFGTTFQHLEQDTVKAPTSGPASGKATLDVNAFQRLLLTGQGRESDTVMTGPSTNSRPIEDNGEGSSESSSDTSASSLSRQPILVTNHSMASHREKTENHQNQHSPLGIIPPVAAGQRKAPPPPPSSRHGKLINAQPKDITTSQGLSSSPSSISPRPVSPSDVDKPLPAAPRRHAFDDDPEDIFAQEAAGKVPDYEGSTAPAFVAPESGKKPTPAPPPRRGHNRAESRQSVLATSTPLSSGEQKIPQPRSENLRNPPAPPPSRRPGPLPRLSSRFSPHLAPMSGQSPTWDSEGSTVATPAGSSTVSLDISADDQTQAPHQQKLSPPPPPPARNSSVRRSTKNLDGASRRLSSYKGKENTAPPPPPPPRARGSSKGSMDARSIDSAAGYTSPSAYGTGTDKAWSVSNEPTKVLAAEPDRGADILADLNALQREVDALRGQIQNT
ncbi:hypothetical protein ACRALDRAFT_2043660 [Sodiomyces alcalophilus JCM 7366]|uniref:uncharacterized protein n=1 Tax=Sodiomyces alcalophilus JCM 7366 TaxID=591952 RepID=UPI0039B5BEEC